MCSCRTQKRPAFPGYSRSNESGNSGTGPSTICGAAKPVQFSAIEALSRSFGQFFCLLYCRKGFREESTCGQPRCTQISTTRSLTVRTIVKQVVVTDFSGCGNTKELARYVLKRRRRASKKPGGGAKRSPRNRPNMRRSSEGARESTLEMELASSQLPLLQVDCPSPGVPLRANSGIRHTNAAKLPRN